MIKYNLKTINDWYKSTSPIKKVMYNSNVAYTRKVRVLPQRWFLDESSFLCNGYDKYEKYIKQYSMDDGVTWENYTPEISKMGELLKANSVSCGAEANQRPCFAVVNNISSYTDRTYDKVFETSSNKWYVKNNLNAYEEYGVFAEGRDISYYQGKLTIDNGVEYQYSGSSWVSLGEVTSTGKSSDFTTDDVNTTSTTNLENDGYYVISYKNKNSYNRPEYMMSYETGSTTYLSDFNKNSGLNSLDNSTIIDAAIWKLEAYPNSADTYYIKNINNNKYFGFQEVTSDHSLILVDDNEKIPVLIPQTITEGCLGLVETVTDNSSNGCVNGGHAVNQLYGYTYRLNWWNNPTPDCSSYWATDGNAEFVFYKVNGLSISYPLEYAEIAAPENNLILNSMSEAEDIQCPFVGMRVRIGGVLYQFSEEFEWVIVPKYATVNLKNQWQESTSYGSLSSSTNNYSFYQSFSNYHVDNGIAEMTITIYGYQEFSFKVRQYGESYFDFVQVLNLDDTSTISSWNRSTSVGDGTYLNQRVKYNGQGKASSSNWDDVTFSNLDGGEHVIRILYGKDGSGQDGTDRGYVAIPSIITDEKWVVVANDYICDSGDKYQKQEYYIKIEGNSEWMETGTFRKGEIIELSSNDCKEKEYINLSDVIASSTTESIGDGYNVSPRLGAFNKIRLDITKGTTSESYCYFAFANTLDGSETLAINNLQNSGRMAGIYGNDKNYINDANGSQTFATWVDDEHTIVEIDIASLTENQTTEMYLLKWQLNCNTSAISFALT